MMLRATDGQMRVLCGLGNYSRWIHRHNKIRSRWFSRFSSSSRYSSPPEKILRITQSPRDVDIVMIRIIALTAPRTIINHVNYSRFTFPSAVGVKKEIKRNVRHAGAKVVLQALDTLVDFMSRSLVKQTSDTRKQGKLICFNWIQSTNRLMMLLRRMIYYNRLMPWPQHGIALQIINFRVFSSPSSITQLAHLGLR